MKNSLLILFTLVNFFLFSQKEKITNKTSIQDFGTTFTVDNPDLILNKDKVYKVIFDIYTDSKDDGKINPLLNTVARFINMHVETGVPLKNLKIVVIMHGKATKNVLNAATFLKKYNIKNPNNELLIALKQAEVETYVCGQSYAYNKFETGELNENVKMALSALTVLVEYQSQGYQLITFN
jgi:intracellular sulfur oxidation DsrE/DsrF family protein